MVWTEQRLVAAALRGQSQAPAAEKEEYKLYRVDDLEEGSWNPGQRASEM